MLMYKKQRKYFIFENLTGPSRSGGMSAWDYYVVKVFDIFKVEAVPTKIKSNASIFILDVENSQNPDSEKNYFIKAEHIQIPEHKIAYIIDSKKFTDIKKKTSLAKVVFDLQKKDQVYYVPLNQLDKPKELTKELESGGTIFTYVNKILKAGSSGDETVQKMGDSDPEMIFDKNSKLFIPAFFHLTSDEQGGFTNAEQLKNTILKEIDTNTELKEKKFINIKNYLKSITELVANSSVNTNAIYLPLNANPSFKIHRNDMLIISKNFGEVLSGLFVLKNVPGSSRLVFPKAANAAAYDFVVFNKDGDKKIYFSVKSESLSNSDIKSIKNFINLNDLKNILKKNKNIPQNDVNLFLEVLLNAKGSDFNNPDYAEVSQGEEKLRTTDLFRKLLSKYYPEKEQQIINTINKYFNKNGLKLNSLSKSDLDDWYGKIKGENQQKFSYTREEFAKNFANVLKEVFGKTKNLENSLAECFDMSIEAQSSKDHGYIMYYIGSFLKDQLNTNKNIINILNIVMQSLSDLYYSVIVLTNSGINIEIKKFSNCTFRFTYNGGSKYPNNRPLGFIFTK